MRSRSARPKRDHRGEREHRVLEHPLYSRNTSDNYPIVFAQNEGFVIQASVPATGTWFFR
jgi:hypothetical protein